MNMKKQILAGILTISALAAGAQEHIMRIHMADGT